MGVEITYSPRIPIVRDGRLSYITGEENARTRLLAGALRGETPPTPTVPSASWGSGYQYTPPQAVAPPRPGSYETGNPGGMNLVEQAYRQAMAEREASHSALYAPNPGAFAAGRGIGELVSGGGVTDGADFDEIKNRMTNALYEWANRSADQAGQAAASSYGGAIAAVNKQIAETEALAARDTGIINSLIDDTEAIYARVRADAKAAGERAAKAVTANSAAARKELRAEHQGAEGKVRAIMDLVGAEGNEAMFTELAADLGEVMGFIEQGAALTADGQARLVDMSEQMARKAAKATEATMVGEYTRNLDELVTKYNDALRSLFDRRSALYAARARAVEAARAQFLEFGGDFFQGPDEYAEWMLDAYVEGTDVPRQDQYLVLSTLQEMDQWGVSSLDELAAARVQAAAAAGDVFDADAFLNALSPYYDVIQQGSGVAGQAYTDWDDMAANPYDRFSQAVSEVEAGRWGRATPQEIMWAVNDQDRWDQFNAANVNYAANPYAQSPYSVALSAALSGR